MCKIKLETNKVITNHEEILKQLKHFYEYQYTSKSTSESEIFFKDATLPILSDHHKRLCDADLTLQECKSSLLSFKDNKSPGTDGIPVEFYKVFWDLLGKPMFESFKYAFTNGEMSTSQKLAISILMDKRENVYRELATYISFES